MQTKLVVVLSATVATSTLALAQPHHEQHGGGARPAAPAAHASGRPTGTIARPRMSEPVHAQHNPPHQRVYVNARTGREERHGVVYEHRPPAVVEHDRYAHGWNRGYHPHYEWRHFYPTGGWYSFWGIQSYDTVGTVTCEAADEATGALYPVTAPRDAYGWNDESIDGVLGQALDECAAEVGPDRCVAATPPCTFTSY